MSVHVGELHTDVAAAVTAGQPRPRPAAAPRRLRGGAGARGAPTAASGSRAAGGRGGLR